MGYTKVERRSGNFEDDDREIYNAKIGFEFEGYYVRKSAVKEGRYGEYQVFFFDLLDGEKIGVRCSLGKPIHDQLEDAELEAGDLVKAVVFGAESKAGNTFADAEVFVDHSPKKKAPAASKPKAKPEPAPAAEVEEGDEEELDF